MAAKSAIIVYTQVLLTALALVLNLFLIFVLTRSTKSLIGSYKYLLILFAVFEMSYALEVLIGMPIHYVVANSWLVFNYEGLIGRTSFNWLGPSLYCVFYYLWIELVVIHFIYRYVVVCRSDLKNKIETTWTWKTYILIVYVPCFAFAFACGMYFCMQSEISKVIKDKLRTEFDVWEPETIGYLLFRIKDLKGDLNINGLLAVINHYIVIFISAVIIIFCGVNIWITIGKMQQQNVYHKREVNLQWQMFFTLLIQTFIPLVLVHLPTAIFMTTTLPFVSEEFGFGTITSIFSLLTAVPKVLDPVVVIICIREYRHTALKIIGCGNLASRFGTVGIVSSSSGYISRGGSLKPEVHGVVSDESRPYFAEEA